MIAKVNCCGVEIGPDDLRDLPNGRAYWDLACFAATACQDTKALIDLMETTVQDVVENASTPVNP